MAGLYPGAPGGSSPIQTAIGNLKGKLSGGRQPGQPGQWGGQPILSVPPLGMRQPPSPGLAGGGGSQGVMPPTQPGMEIGGAAPPPQTQPLPALSRLPAQNGIPGGGYNSPPILSMPGGGGAPPPLSQFQQDAQATGRWRGAQRFNQPSTPGNPLGGPIAIPQNAPPVIAPFGISGGGPPGSPSGVMQTAPQDRGVNQNPMGGPGIGSPPPQDLINTLNGGGGAPTGGNPYLQAALQRRQALGGAYGNLMSQFAPQQGS